MANRKLLTTTAIREGNREMENKKELIEYLSKEIETHTTTMSAFRLRIAFTLFVGPYIALGTYLVAKNGALVCFFGFCAGLTIIEEHTWKQCNRWRNLIAQILNGNELQQDKAGQFYFDYEHFRLCYVCVFALMATSFVSLLFLLDSTT